MPSVDDAPTFPQLPFQHSYIPSQSLFQHSKLGPSVLYPLHTSGLQPQIRLFSTSVRRSRPTSTSTSTSTSQPASSKPSSSSTPKLTHLTPNSEIHIVPISSKAVTTRHATAIGYVAFQSPEVLKAIRSATLRKGDVLSVARVAGIQAAKRTPDLVPLCHPAVQLEGVRCWVEVVDGVASEGGQVESTSKGEEGEEEAYDKKLQTYLSTPIGSHGGIRLAAAVSCSGKTGVEMEALCVVAGAGLCVLDMVKGTDRAAALEGIRNVRKSGGRSGMWSAEGWEDT